MMHIVYIAIIFASLALGPICAEILYKLGIRQEVTRKIGHIGGGVAIAMLPFFVDLKTGVAMGIILALIIAWTKKKKLFQSIHRSASESVGAVLFVPSLILTGIIFWPHHPIIFQGATLILAFSDGLAGLAGSLRGTHTFTVTGPKTLEGSCIFFASTLVIMSFFLYVQGIPFVPSKIVFIISSSLVLTCVEAACGRGWDNVFVPLVAGGILTLAL